MDAGRPGVPLPITLCHVRHPLRYPFRLYAFAPQAVDTNGNVQDPLASGEVLYAVIVNLPVSLQCEAAIAYVYDLVLRQRPIAEVQAGRRKVDELPQLTADADAASAEAASDLLRFGWKRTASILQLRAAEAGFRMQVRFRRDPFPNREDVVRRMPALRRLYDHNAPARDLVDRTASAFARVDMEVRGGPEAARQSIQQATELASPRQFISHALRDADVCGNGYLQIGTFAGTPRFRCVRPDLVEVGNDGTLVEHRAGKQVVLGSGTMHHRGLEQLDSPYGISALEPLLFALNQLETSTRTRTFAQTGLQRGDLSGEVRDQLKRLLAVSDALDEQTAKQVAALTDMSSQFLPSPLRSLYFRGRERFGAS